MKMTRAFAPLLFAVLVSGISTLRAATYSLASGYNIYVLGDLKLSNVDAEGRVAVAGNAKLANYGIGSKFSGNPSAAGTTLVVGGDLDYRGGEVHYGSAVHGGTLTGNFGIPRGSVSQGNPLDFAGLSNELTTASSYLGALESTGTTTLQWGGVYLTGTGKDLNVFTLEAAALASANHFVIDAPAGATVLVNITGNAGTMKGMGFDFRDYNGDGTGSTSMQKVLYNFVDATSLNIHSIGVKGSILAPKANVTFQNGNIDGQLIAGSLEGNGEAHQYAFEGDLPSSLQVPEPSSLLLAAAGGLLVLRRRRARVD